MKRVSNSSFTFSLGDFKLICEKASISIEDGRKAVKDGGVPNGYVDGEVSASGEIELDAAALSILSEEAKRKGSWQEIEPVDLLFYAKGTKEEEKVEGFGCLLNLTDIAEYDPTSDKKATTKISFEVTSPDFVRINGVPYLAKDRTEALV
ncbi:MAG: phage protein [Desulforhopalus sp.]